MKKFAQYVGMALLIGLFAASAAFAQFCCPSPPATPVVATADASAFVNTEITADQLVYNQLNTEHGLMISSVKTLDVTNSGYNAFHNGPAADGKGFFSNEMGVKTADTLKVACYGLDVQSQGMSQAMTTAGDAGAGCSATGGAKADASAGGGSGGTQFNATTYNLAGMHGMGCQTMGTSSYVSVNTTTH